MTVRVTRQPTRRARGVVVASGVCVVALTVGACGSEGVYGIPLPGGADVGSDPVRLTLQFDDVLDLVPQSTVKVDGVEVGRVTDISVPGDSWIADVQVEVNSSVDLPANATASIQQTNLLGEKFVQLSVPEGDADEARLIGGDTIPVERTRHATDIEQVFGALSMLLNGGGVAQLAPIVKELNTATSGREDRLRSLIEQANTLIGGLEEQKGDITRALDGLDVLTGTLNQQTEKIDRILADLPVATEVLEQQRPQLTQLLTQLDRLGEVGTDVIERSKDDLIADLRALRPTLQELATYGDELVTDLAFVPTFPFPDGVEKIAQGNSVNLFISADLQIGNQLSTFGVGEGNPIYSPPLNGDPKPRVDPSNPYYNGNGPRPGWPTVSLLPLPPVIPSPTPAPGVPAAAPPSANPLDGILEQFGIGAAPGAQPGGGQ
ncbi:MCE family protein [Rhodococcoides corynebacterioides]|uniref:MCE family protein n=1 Tax=Rhodococcoides corynebacterioides TaxID=53972 RepID=UPI000AFF219D